MAGGSVSQQLEDLLNPQPKFTDPEDDHDEQTKAKLVEKFDDDHEEDEVGFSALRKQSMLPETDTRYRGKAVSRKQLLLDAGGPGEEEEEDDIDEDEIEEEKEDDGSDDDDGDDEEEEEDEEDQDGSGGDEEDDPDENDEEGGKVEETQAVRRNGRAEMKTLVSKMRSTDITFPQGVDLHQLTEGMDDVGESESGEEESESGEEESEGSDGSSEEDDGDEDGVTVRTFSKEKVDEEVEKGQAVKDQLALWDHLLEGRIKIQKALLLANQLPQPQTLPEFKSKGGAEFAGALKNSHKALKGLQRSLLELQDQLLYQNPDTRSISLGQTWTSETQHEDEVLSEDEMETVRETGPPKRKLEMAEYPDFMAKRFSSFQPYRNATLQKWHDKTRLTMGKSSKGFGAFERNILTQVEQVLMDKERLLRRTQTRRSEFRVLGKTETTAPAVEALTEGDEVQRLLKANSHLKDLDEDIFDDDDFYHQLLRELIERKTSAADPNDQVAMGRQWLAIQKLRSKIKKKVDTKASKGRKVRFHIHSKLVNFMAPVDHSSMNDDARTELYRCLFGGSVSVQPQVQEEQPDV